LDFFNLLNHANFNPSSGTFTPFVSVNCGSEIGVDASNGNPLFNPCSPTNNLVTHQTSTNGFGNSNAVIGGNSARQIQYTLHFNF
jgi:hypothetical protein